MKYLPNEMNGSPNVNVRQWIDAVLRVPAEVSEMRGFVEEARQYYRQFNEPERADYIVQCNIGYALGEVVRDHSRDAWRKLWREVIQPIHWFQV